VSEKTYPRGFKDGAKWAIAYLHQRALEMNDPHAKTILNTAAFNMGVDLKNRFAVAPALPSEERQ